MTQGRTFWWALGRDYARHSSSEGCQHRRFIQTCVVLVVACGANNKEEPSIACINSSFNVLEQLQQKRASAGTLAHMEQGPLSHAQGCTSTKPRLALQECSAPEAVLAARKRTEKDEPLPTHRSTANLGKANSLSHDTSILISGDVRLGKTKFETEPSGVLASDSVFSHGDSFHDGFHLMQVIELAEKLQDRPDLLVSNASANGTVLATGSAPSTQGTATDENYNYLLSQANTSRRLALELISFSDNQTSNAIGHCTIGAIRKHLVKVWNTTRQQLSLATTWVSHVQARRMSMAVVFGLVLGLLLVCTIIGAFVAMHVGDMFYILFPSQYQNQRGSPSGGTTKTLRSDSLASISDQSLRRDNHPVQKPPPTLVRGPTRDEFHAPTQTPEADVIEAAMGVPPLCPSLVVPQSSECVLTLPFFMYDLAGASLPGSSPQRSGTGLRVNNVTCMDGTAMFRIAFGNDAGDVTAKPWLTLSGIGNSSIVAIAHQTDNVRRSLTVFDTLKRPFGQLVVESSFRHGWTFTLKPVKGQQIHFQSSDSNMNFRVVNNAGELLALVEPVGSDALGFQAKRQATFGPCVDVGLFLVCLLCCDWLKADMTA
eukprot:TRINITY_DN1715_c0_g3_i1.p1 TRINITY_DN1715_c0_g3~~TRINITY_DN1715_c0_g3_i1.p1  ORF type:complete len:599 (+),score=61.49 TRINITY_DN1715_c0_g3_i1:146-1942(+)